MKSVLQVIGVALGLDFMIFISALGFRLWQQVLRALELDHLFDRLLSAFVRWRKA